MRAKRAKTTGWQLYADGPQSPDTGTKALEDDLARHLRQLQVP